VYTSPSAQGPEEPHPVDNFLQDHDVIEIIEDSFEKDDLNEAFYTISSSI
jgi:hypothetical protein